ncbi:cache domain-containing sensor histidine kinase [Cohnella zeiphila]|uniref:histidine kinase n=1 Tax=Cohnella zeiphila TaxID=2761120 RepID=A0A7X0SNL0_9BACL|nr:sensor histidine kinase [Cohnella zeiphila]MBB6733318.1 sensor histidine kinase [Cohnella zeiphila]
MRRWSHSLFVRFSAAFLLVGLLPLIALSVFSLRTFTTHVERNTVNNLDQMVYYMGSNLDNLYSKYNEVTKLMYLRTTDGSNLGAGNSVSVSVNEHERINQMSIDDFLTTVMYSDSYIRNVFFVRASDGKLYSQNRDNKALLPNRLPLTGWLGPVKDNPRQLALFPTHDESYYAGSARKVMTVGRNLIDTSGTDLSVPKVVGTLFFDVDASVFDDLFHELNLGPKDELYVVDGSGFVFYSNRGDSGKQIADGADSRADMLTFSQDIPFLNGKVIVRASKGDLYERLTSTRTAVLIAIGICSAVLIGMGVWFSRRLSSPIRSVIRMMARVESGNLDVQPLPGGLDEVGRLSHGFNRMVERLRTFIEEAYVAEIKQKQTELNALKSQIRPHYLYNTLEVIRMNAVASDADEVGDMILSLSKQLKYVIDYGEDLVSLRRELDHLRNYFDIIKVRYENRVGLECETDDAVDPEWLIPKLSLQPIVENAVQHGILPNGGKGTVRLTVRKAEERVVLTVSDDGVGLSPAALEKLESRLNEPSPVSRSIGMKNVHERIRTMYGPEYGLSIGSRPSLGTSVRMILPIREGSG